MKRALRSAIRYGVPALIVLMLVVHYVVSSVEIETIPCSQFEKSLKPARSRTSSSPTIPPSRCRCQSRPKKPEDHAQVVVRGRTLRGFRRVAATMARVC